MKQATANIPDLSAATTPLEAARIYAEAGIPVFPCDLDKAPTTKHGLYDATCELTQILKWFGSREDLFVATPMEGYGDHGAVAIDVDDPAAVTPELRKLLDETAFHASKPATQPGRGHYVFTLPDGDWKPGNSQGDIPKGIDVKGIGGYIIAWGKRGEDVYTWQSRTLRPLPAELRAMLQAARERTGGSSAEVAAFLEAHAYGLGSESMQQTKADEILRSFLERPRVTATAR
jgi:hypothetical protein